MNVSMNRSYLSTIVGVGLIFLAQSASGQLPGPSPKAPVDQAASSDKSNQKPEADRVQKVRQTQAREAQAEADRVAKERRAQARSLLLSLASDARSFHNQIVRARTLARIADALWDTDTERGRELFRKAWEAAGSADQEIARKRQEEIVRQRTRPSGGGGYAIVGYPNIRGELLRLASRRDRELGEEFLQSLKADQQQGVNGENQRLSLARELLVTGDPERALQFASSELATINLMTVDFLSWLRKKNAVAADQRYATMVDIAAGNALSDASTVSLLSSYLFTPHVYVTFQGGGMSYSMMGSDPPLTSVPPALQLRFFQMAANVLLRASPQPQPNQPTGGIEETYLGLKLMIPLFEQYAPKEMTDAMRVRFEALGAMVRESVRQRRVDTKRETPSAEQSEDRERTILDRIERAKTSAERDQLYFHLAQEAVQKDDLRARDFVSKVEDMEFRNQARAYIDVSLAVHLIQRKKIDLGLELAQKGELSHIQRVWLLTRLAKLMVKTDRDRSLSLLDDAVPEARRIDGLDPDRPRALLAIANALRLIEPSRAWDSLFEAVKAANSADGFTGEDGNLNIVFQAGRFSSASDNDEPDFDIRGIFGSLAQDDYDRAVEFAGGFQGEAPRAAAVLAIAQSVLNEKKAPASTAPPAPKN
jgi:hypothetical protein